VNRFTGAVEKALLDKNWYAALIVSLVLPDICGKLEEPQASSGERYARWFDRFVRSGYVRPVGPAHQPHVFLCGQDCYALRCSFLHEGTDEIGHQRARQVLDRFRFVVPPAGSVVHLNQRDGALQIQVDIFCRDICRGVEHWAQAVLQSRPEIQARLATLLTVESLEGGVKV
jgi:hypothetical protein